MKLAIVGSRDFTDYKILDDFIRSKFDLSEIDTVVSGGAKGADALAERFAEEHNFKIDVKKAEWGKYGRAAGPIRNALIVEEADAVVAFPTVDSRGTKNSMEIARKKNKRIEVLYV